MASSWASSRPPATPLPIVPVRMGRLPINLSAALPMKPINGSIYAWRMGHTGPYRPPPAWAQHMHAGSQRRSAVAWSAGSPNSGL